MARLLSILLLPSLLFLSTSIILGHAKPSPHIFQDADDGPEASADSLPRSLYSAGRAESDGMVVVGDMLVPQSLYQLYFSSSYVAPRKGISLDNYLWTREEGVPTIPYEYADEQRPDSAERDKLDVMTVQSLRFPEQAVCPTFSVWIMVRYQSVIEAGLRHWEQHTCLTFRQRTSLDTNWLTFIHGDGCYSSVGRVGQGQSVSIGTGCQWLGTVVHEVGHAIGLFHEQMRSDRDDHVVINWQNIPSDYEINFAKETMYENNRSVAYDYTSIMHYGGRDFSTNGRSTIATKQPEHQGLLGQAQGLSHRDKHIVNIMYGCIDQWQAACPSAVTCEGEGYLGPDCTCVCPPGREGDRCEVNRADYYADSLPSCSRTITTEISFTSPNYPQNIPSGTWCVYKVEAPVGQVPEVIFNSFSFHSVPAQYRCSDFLEVRDSDIHDGEVFCGNGIKNGQSFVGASRHLYLYLDAYTASSQGFQAEVMFHDASNPPKPKTGGVSGLSPSTLVVLVALLVARVFTKF